MGVHHTAHRGGVVKYVALAVVLAAASSADATPNGHRRCREVSDVVGYQRCSRFGRWSASAWTPANTIETGFVIQRIEGHRALAAARTVDEPDGDAGLLAVAPRLRLDFAFFGRYYTALEGAAGRAWSQGGNLGTSEAITSYLAGSVVGGVQLWIAHANLASELAYGVRAVTPRRMESSTPSTMQATVLEARIRGVVWLSSWVTLGGSIGIDVADHSNISVAIHVGFHSRTFDARRE